MEHEEFKKKKTDDQDHRRDDDVLTDRDIIEPMNDARNDDTEPKSLDTLHASVSLPSECPLAKRKTSGIVDGS